MNKEENEKYPNSAFVRMDGGWKRINVNSINVIEANCYKCSILMSDGRVLPVSKPLSETLADLDSPHILRIHRSFAVNIDRIDMLYPGMVRMEGGKEITIGREFRELVKQRFIILDTRNRSKSLV